jgi:maltose O-acetyltransferase
MLNYLFGLGVRIIWKPLYYILFFNQLRAWMPRLKATQIGKGVRFRPGFDVFGNGKVFIGNNVGLFDVFINCVCAEVHIGDNAFFGHRVMIITGNHDYATFGIDRQKNVSGKNIYIEEGAWIGSGAIILGGVRVGKNAVIAAGSIVVTDVPDNWIFGGVPAKAIKPINP